MAEENEKLLAQIMNLGERLLECGGSVHRVEDTIHRICASYGAARTDVFAITSSIVVTMERGGEIVTQTRRINGSTTDFYQLEELNALSRKICADPPSPDEFHRMLEETGRAPEKRGMILAGYLLASGAFAIFFGGGVMDALCAALIAIGIRLLDRYMKPLWHNSLLHSLICSTGAGLCAYLLYRIGLCVHPDLVMIGDIMLLIPGIALTNSLRDLFNGDTISGLLRLMEALLQAGVVALGFGLAVYLEGVLL